MNIKYHWTDIEIELLKEKYQNTVTKDLVPILNKPIHAIIGKASLLGLKKSKEHLSKLKQLDQKRLPVVGKNERFAKGHTPWNKGMKGLQTGGKETQFKKGQQPHNTKEDGAISIRKDSNGNEYKYIRIAKGKWDLLHRHVWKQEHGEIKKGLIITFKNGNSLDCRIENLKIITRAEHARINRGHYLPKHVKDTIRALNKFKKIINNEK